MTDGGLGLSDAAISVWGKTDRMDGSMWLPLYVHMADSLVMAEHIWDHWVPSGTKDIIGRSVGETELARKVYMFLAGVHDIGKATPVFQLKPIRFDPLADSSENTLAWLPKHAGLPFPQICGRLDHPSHPIAGQVILERYLCDADAYGWDRHVASSYACVVGGHHGTPPTRQKLIDADQGELIRMGYEGPQPTPWMRAQRELIEFVRRRAVLSPDDMRALGERMLSPQAESVLTGLVIMADWVASNSDDGLFPLVPVRGSAGDLKQVSRVEGASNRCAEDSECDAADVRTWEGLRRRAQRAWDDLGMCGPWRSPVEPEDMPGIAGDGFEDWFRSRFQLPDGAKPRPMQREAVRVAAMTDDPGLMVVEAPMGEGKTEAALAAAELLARRSGRGGVCVALPTMATTDAMFGRVHAWLDALPQSPDHDEAGGDVEKTMWLAHGKSQLNEEFRGIIAATHRALSSVDTDGSIWNQESARRVTDRATPEAVVSDWMWGRKKGALANFLVCTVDQVLMGALQMKHVVLRQLALANKVVIIDECHAYDAYMREYLKRVLEWLGGFHTPVILLSATLPERQRDDMVAAYLAGRSGGRALIGQDGSASGKGASDSRQRRGRSRRDRLQAGRMRRSDEAAARHAVDVPSPESSGSVQQAYPLITYTSGGKVFNQPVPPSGRQAEVRCGVISDDDGSLIALLDSLLDDGGCVGVICDTVGRAQHAAELLIGRYGHDAVRLTHSRFIDLDRMDNERELRELLGPQSTIANGGRPHRLIVVGTQVLEQSLDIDFDALITDIAPVDLVMQRLGRVHRHRRGEGEADRPAGLRVASCYLRGITSWQDDGPHFDGDVANIYAEASLMESLCVMGIVDAEAAKVIRLPEDIAIMVRGAYGEAASSMVTAAWCQRYGEAVTKREKEQQEKLHRARGYLMRSLHAMEHEEESLVDWFVPQIDERDDDRGQRAVRDTQETVEVMLLRRHDNGVALLPWVGDKRHGVRCGAEVTTQEPPDGRIAVLMSQSSVRLPLSMCRSDRLDDLIDELERSCGDISLAWQDSPCLAGRLALVMDEDDSGLHAAIDGFTVSYSRQSGLNVAKSD